MDFQEVINKRKSVRSFKPVKIPNGIIKELISDAAKSPSAKNLQPWYFVVVRSDPNLKFLNGLLKKSLKTYSSDLDKMSLKLQNVAREFYSCMGDCKTVVLIYFDMPKDDFLPYEINLMSVSAAIENLILSATNKGLGSCWVGSFKGFENEINKKLSVKNKSLVAAVLLGYQKDDYVPLSRKKKRISKIFKFV